MVSIILPSHNEPKIEELKKQIHSLFPHYKTITSHDFYGQGKGWAIRRGLKEAIGAVIFLDGDGDIEPRMIKRLLPFLEDYDIVVGRKSLTGSWVRRILTFFSRFYIKLMFGIKVDTQTGIKIFRSYVLEPWFTNGYAFDIEILARAKKMGFSMVEVPVEAKITEGKSWKVILETLKESLKIKFWYL